MHRFALGAALALSLIAGQASQAVAQSNISRQIPVDGDFIDSEISWQSLPGGYQFKLNVIAVDGKFEVCGVGTSTNAQTRRFERRLLRGAKFTVNDRPILTDLSFFNRVSRPSQLDTAIANCRATGVAVPRGRVSFGIDWPEGRFRM